ncbi:Membrane protein involved in colicin uptake [Paramagnetospirillum magnetotacticum MS-1]|uniref:Membrane protein involved in colicin uptake n=1 Tax=Paramagnetospirillum magnetotacticum MS-1 TaxID=272627 RepID=A0A0C2YKL4_PARME|nr:DUF2325 domain-containing protein [Paramagnetospirillum magnetotacticum]KIM00335.1 Membrane protein involved in colicin uptake [Paramagnetospirillum magnetotacticum MS-1]
MSSQATDTFDLSGRLILYVGGRHQHVAHLRRLVEERGGGFVHHDGGVEQSMTKLANHLERADAVLFPVGCVSHQAQSKVKDLCRRFEKPFKPLRSTGIGAITQALESLTTN